MDERVRKVVKRVAQGVWDERVVFVGGSQQQVFKQCHFCCVAPHEEHTEDCPVRVAQQLELEDW